MVINGQHEGDDKMKRFATSTGAFVAALIGPLLSVGLFAQTTGSETAIGLNAITFQAVSLLPPGTSGGYTVLHTFQGPDGGNPIAGVVRDSAGNLYGTTEYGGESGAGVVYMLASNGNETVLYSFTGGADGGIRSRALSWTRRETSTDYLRRRYWVRHRLSQLSSCWLRRGVHAGYDRQGDGAVRVHGRGRWTQPRLGCVSRATLSSLNSMMLTV